MWALTHAFVIRLEPKLITPYFHWLPPHPSIPWPILMKSTALRNRNNKKNLKTGEKSALLFGFLIWWIFRAIPWFHIHTWVGVYIIFILLLLLIFLSMSNKSQQLRKTAHPPRIICERERASFVCNSMFQRNNFGFALENCRVLDLVVCSPAALVWLCYNVRS